MWIPFVKNLSNHLQAELTNMPTIDQIFAGWRFDSSGGSTTSKSHFRKDADRSYSSKFSAPSV